MKKLVIEEVCQAVYRYELNVTPELVAKAQKTLDEYKVSQKVVLTEDLLIQAFDGDFDDAKLDRVMVYESMVFPVPLVEFLRDFLVENIYNEKGELLECDPRDAEYYIEEGETK